MKKLILVFYLQNISVCLLYLFIRSDNILSCHIMLQCGPHGAYCHISLPIFQGKSRKKYTLY